MAKNIRIWTNAGAPALGTYTQAIRVGDLVFVTGQTGRNPETGALEDGLEAQTRRTLTNVEAILQAGGCTVADIAKVTLIMANIEDFKVIDRIYAEWLPIRGVTALPARTAFAAKDLPHGALVMLDCIASFPGD
ncbi:MAG TPA: RidA family protein [Enhygromyxa sp.]|nr:RidA family protein [Enhygromyxa sp.]